MKIFCNIEQVVSNSVRLIKLSSFYYYIKKITNSNNIFNELLIYKKSNSSQRIKRFSEFLLSLFLLIILSPLILLSSLLIKIEDNGPGIPEKEYDNVFKPFYKIDKGRADSKSSVGLGLSIASDIIRSHGGNIKLEKSLLNGLGVKIFLPV